MTTTRRTTIVGRVGPAVAVAALLLVALGAGVFLRPARVRGASMEPALVEGQILVLESASYRLARPQRGDVVVVRISDEQWLFAALTGGQYVKRVVGLPGETVSIRRGTVLVNGSALDEPHARRDGAAAEQTVAEVTVPEAAYYVLGDNRDESDDSRTWGPVPAAGVQSRAMGVVWPWGSRS